MKSGLGSLLSLLLILGGLAGGAAYFLSQFWNAEGPFDTDQTFIVDRGESLGSVASALETRGLVGNATIFKLAARLEQKGGRIKAGEYLIPAASTPSQIISILESGQAVQRRLRVADGSLVYEVWETISAVETLTGDMPEPVAEGTLLPETYFYTLNENRENVVARMQNAMTTTVEELWPSRQEDLPINSAEEAIILASIVEKETGLSEERPQVAGVFVNRLRIGMRLQSDPTTIFALTKGKEPLGRALLRRDLTIEDPYNTYFIAGLPPGPIANPSRASIEAVLNPAEHDYLYFVADGTGGHAFARTLQEHNRNVAAWRKVQNR